MPNASLQLADFTDSDKERFWGRVNKSGPKMDGAHYAGIGNCWVWTGLQCKGYGKLYLFGRMYIAHRVGWVLGTGISPDGKHVLHRCDNPSCVRSSHLRLGTQVENVADAVARGRAKFSSGPNHAAIMSLVAARGERVAASRLKEFQVVEIRRLYSNGGISKREIARRYGVSHTCVVNVLLGRMWAHVP